MDSKPQETFGERLLRLQAMKRKGYNLNSINEYIHSYGGNSNMTVPWINPMHPITTVPIPHIITTVDTFTGEGTEPKTFFSDPRPEFQIMMDSMFNPVEKLQFLESLGYEFIEGGMYKLDKSKEGEGLLTQHIKIEGSISDIFLKEIMIKFKNLLLAKPVLKMKL